MSEDFQEEPAPRSRRRVARDELEEDELDYDEEETPFPQKVKIAGIIWITVGCLILVNLVASLLLNFVVAASAGPEAAGKAVGGGICPALVIGLFGAAFLHVGIQSIRGVARDTLGNAIGSLVFALIEFGFAAALGAAAVYMNANQNAQRGPALVVAAFVGMVASAIFGLMLFAAGILALAGRSQYKLWRKEEARRLKQEAADRKTARRFRK